MKKTFFITPLLLLSLVACGNKTNGNDNSNDSKGDTQTTESGGNSEGGQTTGHSGLTASDAFTVEELISFMSNYSANQISDKEYYVTGVLGDSSYNSQYKQYIAYFQNHMKADSQPVQLYSAVLDASITGDYTAANAMAGATVVAKGYLELFVNESGKKIYELPYLKAELSPSGKKYNPTIVSITGGNQGGGSSTGGDTGGDTGGGESSTDASYGVRGTIDSSATSKAFDFAAAKSQCPTDATLSQDKDVVKTVTISGSSFKEANCYNSSNVTYWQFGAKKYGSNAWVANVDAIPGNIVGIKMIVPAGGSGNTRFHFGFSKTALTSSFVEGDAVKPVAEGSQSSLPSDVTMEIVPIQNGEYKYFNITAEYIAKNQFNGSVTTVTVYYK